MTRSPVAGAGVSTGAHEAPSQCSTRQTRQVPLFEKPTAQQSLADGQAVPESIAPTFVRGWGVPTMPHCARAEAGAAASRMTIAARPPRVSHPPAMPVKHGGLPPWRKREHPNRAPEQFADPDRL